MFSSLYEIERIDYDGNWDLTWRFEHLIEKYGIVMIVHIEKVIVSTISQLLHAINHLSITVGDS